MYLHLRASGHTEVTREADPDDRWSAADTATSWSVGGITLSDHDGHYALPADFPVEVGDLVYAVYAVYSTGDSFHRAEGEYLEIISFHKNAAIAERNIAALSVHRGRDSDFKMLVEYDSGAKVERHCSWVGYFESLDYVTCSAFIVQAS